MARKDLASQQVFSKFSENGNKHLVCGRSCCEKITQTKHVEKLFGLFSDVGSTPTVSTKKTLLNILLQQCFLFVDEFKIDLPTSFSFGLYFPEKL